MATSVDARGLSCPEPVIVARKALGKGDLPVVVLVDNATSRDNVARMARGSGHRVAIEEKGGEFVLTIDRS